MIYNMLKFNIPYTYAVVNKEEPFQGFILVLATVTILLSVSSKLKQMHMSFTLIIFCHVVSCV